MAEDWRERLATARKGVRSILLWYGVCSVLAVIVAFTSGAALFDWLVHATPALRVLLLTTGGALIAWVAYRNLFRPLRVPLDDLRLAMRIERLHPELSESLSSMVSFETQPPGDPLAGSLALRQAVAREANRTVANLDFKDVINPKPRRTAAVWAAVAGLVAAALITLDPASASIALKRLALPFTGPEWPKRTLFDKIDYPNKMAKGDPFQANVDLKGVIPERVTVAYRFADGEETAPVPINVSAESSHRFIATLDAATQPFVFKIQGNDNETEWLPVDVVPAPDITELKLSLTPPAYTRLPAIDYPPGRGHIEAVVGTHVKLSAQSNKPLLTGQIVWQNLAPTPVTISPDGLGIAGEFVVAREENYRLLVEDTGKMSNEHRSPKIYRVEALADKAPEVVITEPTSDLEVTRNAQPKITARVRDDFGIQDIELRYTIERPGAVPTEGTTLPVETISLYKGDENSAERKIEHLWDLTPLDLALGSVVTFKVTGRDYRTPPEPNVGESRPIRLRIVGESDILRQLDTEQKLLREELDRMKKLEENALTQTTDLTEKAKEEAPITSADRDKLQSTETIQKRVREKASEGESSVAGRVKALRERMNANRVNDLDTQKRLELVDSELTRLGEQHLAEIERSLSQARKAAADEKATDGNQAQPGAMKDSLENARDHQERVVESLAAMLEQLDKWESVAEVVGEARDLERRQIENAEQVGAISKSTLGKTTEDLTSEEKVGLAQGAARQEEIRQQLGRLERKMARQAEKTQADDPAAAEAIQKALEQTRSSNLGGKMSEATADIRENRLADAGQRQSEISQGLRDLVESLENRQEQELKRLVKELKEAEGDLEQIREEQKRLRKETEEAEQIADAQKRQEELKRLRQKQAELRAKSEDFARRLSRLQARTASRSSGRAASRMGGASESMDQGEGEEAGQQQEEALEQLEQAQEELAESRQEAEEKLAQEQLAKVADSIKNVHERQRAITEDVKRLDELRKKEGKLTRGQTQSVLGLSRAERGLAEESEALREQLDEAKVFSLVIEEAVEQMKSAADQLGEKSTGADAQKSLDRAAKRFAQLLDSLRKDTDQQQAKGKKGQQPQQGDGEGAGEGGQDGIPSIAQIKLLRSLQNEILDDTKQLAEGKPTDGWNDQQKAEFEKLARRQGRLADIVRDMMKPEEETPGSEEENAP